MGIFSKSKGASAKFDYYVLIHSLSPFPAQYKSLYITWQRGSGKKGQSRAVGPSQEGPGRSWCTFQFEEAFHVPCTLTQDVKAKGTTGPFEKKWLILGIMDGAGKTKEPLGRVVINLADYAADDDRATMSFTVAANKVISADVSECKMLITLGCRSKGKPEMALGGKALARNASSGDRSVASSEYSEDEGSDLGSPGTTTSSQPMVKPLGIIRERSGGQPVRQGTYDADGFLVDDEDEDVASPSSSSRQSTQDRNMPSAKPPLAPVAQSKRTPAKAAPAPDSDADSEDDFLAQAVAAMDGGGPMPIAPGSSAAAKRGMDSSRGTTSSSAMTPAASIGTLIKNQRGSKPLPASPFDDPAARATGPSAPIAASPFFALRPEGAPPEPRPEPKAEEIVEAKPESRPAAPAEPRIPSPESITVAPGVSKRELKPKGDTPGGMPPRRVSRLVSRFEPAEDTQPPAPQQSIRRTTVDKDRQQAAASFSSSGPPASTTDRQRSTLAGSPRQRSAGQDSVFLDDDTAADVPRMQGDRVDRSSGGSTRRLVSDGLDSPSSRTDSPRRRKVADSRSQKSVGVVLPNTVSIRKAVVPAEPEPKPSNSKHWLDEGIVEVGSVSTTPEASPRGPTPQKEVIKAKANPLWDRGTNGAAAPVEAAKAIRPNPEVLSLQDWNKPSGASTEKQADAKSRALGDSSQAQAPSRIAASVRVPPIKASASEERQAPVSAGEVPQEGHTPPANGTLYSGGALSTAQSAGDAQMLEVMTRELRTVAALEASVYLARCTKGRSARSSSKAHNLHAPARRLARTTISLGPEEGIIFGLRSIRAIEAAAEGASDVEGRAYWWSNCIQLRWMLWAMCHGGGSSDEVEYEGEPEAVPDEFDWVMQVLVPPLRELETAIFEQMFRHLWSSVLLEGASADMLPGAQPKQWIIAPSKEEEAVQRWLDALQTAHRALVPLGSVVTAGHMTLLKHKTLTALMRRLDLSLFERLHAGDDSDGTMVRRDTFSSAWKRSNSMQAERDVPLDGRLLPFSSSGAVSFGVGVNLKMAATRWTNWAADIGLRNDKGSPEEGYMLFPRLRATADLLMMPKEVLTDRAIRSEVVPGLPLRTICDLLHRFQPDDFAHEPLPPGLLEALHTETPVSEASPSPTSKGLAGYEPPSEAALLADGLIEPVSLEMDDESEDEVEALAEMYDPDHQGHTTERFGLLRELWASAR